MTVKMDGEIYSCPSECIWTPQELEDDSKRKCEACGKVCMEIFIRVFSLTEIKNYCTPECYEDS